MRRCGDAGWLHELVEGRTPSLMPIRSAMSAVRRDLNDAHLAYVAAIVPDRILRLASRLFVPGSALRRLRIGWDGRAYTFPMRDAQGRIVGIRRRFLNGRKLAVGGSKNGLFLPDGVAGCDLLFVAEGESDTAALLGLGFEAVGRPGCRSATALCAEYCRGRNVVVVGDNDEAGRSGAADLTTALATTAGTVRCIFPLDAFKDIRDELKSRGTRDGILARVRRATPATVPLIHVLPLSPRHRWRYRERRVMQ